jgi:replicative DNA helicase
MDDLSIRAEQALLGAVLCDPAGQCYLLDLVEPDDMRRPWHAQVLRAMQRVRVGRQLPGPMQVYAELQKDPDLPPSVARDGVLVAELMAAAPDPRHGEAYACQVIEGGIRQRLNLAGSRLAQAAETGDLAAAIHQAAQAGDELKRCRDRWLRLPEWLRHELPQAPRRDTHAVRVASSANVERTRLHPDRLNDIVSGDGPAAFTPPTPETHTVSARREQWQAGRLVGLVKPDSTADMAGEQTLRNLAAAPACLSQVGGWLRPEHFTRASQGRLFAVMRDMNAAGKPVDPLTVAWEATRRGLDAEPADLTGGTGPFAVASARDVHRYSMLAQAEQAGRDIQADAANPTCSPQQLFDGTRARLRALGTEVQRSAQLGREPRVITMPGREAAS